MTPTRSTVGVMDESSGRARRRDAVELADAYGGALSRTMLRGLGIDRHMVTRAADADLWRVHGRQTVGLHTAPLSDQARYWRAVWEVGPAIAHVDGVSALLAAGLTGFTEDRVHVSIPHPARPLAVPGVRIHRVRRWRETDVIGAGLPRVRPEIAAVRAAQWAASDRQAALVLCLAVQQRLVTAARLAVSARDAPRRGAFIRRVVVDLANGAHSLGELDFAVMCRRRGLPTPDRQVVLHTRRGRIYLDVRWHGVAIAVEIDGAQHRQGLAVTDDHLRKNAVTLDGTLVLGIDLVGLRLAEDEFMEQVCAAFRARGGAVGV
jgi:hypothetical protein